MPDPADVNEPQTGVDRLARLPERTPADDAHEAADLQPDEADPWGEPPAEDWPADRIWVAAPGTPAPDDPAASPAWQRLDLAGPLTAGELRVVGRVMTGGVLALLAWAARPEQGEAPEVERPAWYTEPPAEAEGWRSGRVRMAAREEATLTEDMARQVADDAARLGVAAIVWPGCVLVIGLAVPCSPGMARSLRAMLAERLPGVEVGIVDQVAAMAVYTPQDVERLRQREREEERREERREPPPGSFVPGRDE